MRLINCALIVVPLLFVTMGSGPGGNPPGEGSHIWKISSPAQNTNVVRTADVGCSGEAGDAEHGYTVQIVKPNGDLMGSAGGTSTAAFSWGCTVDAPSNGWTGNQGTIKLFKEGESSSKSEVGINFVNP